MIGWYCCFSHWFTFNVNIQWWPKLLEHLTDLKWLSFFASKTLFNFILFMKHADGCSEHNKYQMKWVVLVLFTFNFHIWHVHLLQQLPQHISLAWCQYISWNSNINVIPCLLKLKPKAFPWIYNKTVQFIFQLAPNLLDEVEVQALRGLVHHFQCSSRFFQSQVF